MPLSRNINTYNDVAQILTSARKSGLARTIYKLHSTAAAVNWRMRAYMYRKLLVTTARQRSGNIPGFVPTTEWDDMHVGHNKGDDFVTISFNTPAGKLLNPEDMSEVPIADFEPVRTGATEIIEAPVRREQQVELDDLEKAAQRLLGEKAK